MKSITRSKLADKIKTTAKGAKIIGITYQTSPKVKKGCPYTNVTKTTTNVVMLGVNYENRLAKEGETPAGKEPWFDFVDNQNWLVQHTGKGTLYLRLSPTGNNVPKSTYDSDQGPLTKDELKEYFYASSGTAPQVYTIALENVTRISLAGTEYAVVADNAKDSRKTFSANTNTEKTTI